MWSWSEITVYGLRALTHQANSGEMTPNRGPLLIEAARCDTVKMTDRLCSLFVWKEITCPIRGWWQWKKKWIMKDTLWWKINLTDPLKAPERHKGNAFVLSGRDREFKSWRCRSQPAIHGQEPREKKWALPCQSEQHFPNARASVCLCTPKAAVGAFLSVCSAAVWHNMMIWLASHVSEDTRSLHPAWLVGVMWSRRTSKWMGNDKWPN